MAKRRKPKDKETPPAPAPAKTKEAPRNDFLKPADINRAGTTKIKLTGVMRLYTGDRGVSLICEVIVGGSAGPHRDYSVLIGKRSYITMQRELGRNLAAWAGKVIDVEVDPTGQYVNVHDPEAPITERAPAPPPPDDNIPF